MKNRKNNTNNISVQPHHPLAELLAKCLFGIEIIPPKYIKREVNRAIREAVKWHEKDVEQMKDILKEILECPRIIDEATVPKGGIDVAPKQVVFNMSIGLMRIRKARRILEGSNDG